jgi:hypothetical protein
MEALTRRRKHRTWCFADAFSDAFSDAFFQSALGTDEEWEWEER